MLTKFLVLALVGKIVIYAGQSLLQSIKINNPNSFFGKLVSCDFCFGCWIYFFLDLVFGVWFEGILFVPILSPFLIGVLTSFIVHLISLGWRTKFEVIILE